MLRVKLLDVSANPEQLIFAAGRQCYSAGWVGDAWQTDKDGYISVYDFEKNKLSTDNEIAGLIRHLVKSGHTSVLEHVKFTFAIDGVSRALTHQQVRHRISSYSQQSQRYVANKGPYTPDNYVTPPSIKKNEEANLIFIKTLKYIQKAYNKLSDLGIPAEDARYLMPNASISRIVDTKNCVSLLHFFSLRCCTLAQWEIRKMANEMLKICKETLPVVFENAGPRCVSMGFCPENKKRSCGAAPTKEEVFAGYKMWKESREANKNGD